MFDEEKIRGQKYKLTSTIWSRTIEENSQIIVAYTMVGAFVDNNFKKSISEIKSLIIESVKEMEQTIVEGNEEIKEKNYLMKYAIKEMICAGMKELQTSDRQEIVDILMSKVDELKEPHFTFKDKLIRWYIWFKFYVSYFLKLFNRKGGK